MKPGLSGIFITNIYFRAMALLTVSGVTKQEKGINVVDDISFSQQPLEKMVVAGETGSGKSTLLKMIGGLVQMDKGVIRFKNKKIIGPYDQLIPGHPGIAYLSQHFELRNNYWVHEILEYANKLSEETANELFKVCRIQHLLNRRTTELSGGEKQRIALARLLVGTPQLLLLDEPFSNLDAVHKNIIKSVIDDIGNRLKISCIMVSHDAPDILSWADTILVIRNGQILQQGTPEQIYKQPVNEYCAGLFGSYNLINPGTFPGAVRSSGGGSITGKRLLVRPEQLAISNGEKLELTGIVQQVLFWGSHYTVKVLVNNQVLSVKSSSNHFMEGEPVYLALQQDNWWYV